MNRNRLIENLPEETEQNAIIINKIIQDMMLHDFKDKDRTNYNAQNPLFDKFYEVIERKAESFIKLDEPGWREHLRVEKDSKDNLVKNINMEHSILFYSDIMTHIMMLVDEELLNHNEKLLEKVKKILS